MPRAPALHHFAGTLALNSPQMAHADGLGDVFGEKNDESDEGSGEGASGSQETDKKEDKGGGLADVFGKKKKDDGSSGSTTTEPLPPPDGHGYYYYPYDPYYDLHHYGSGTVYDYPPAYPEGAATDSLFAGAQPGSLEAALRDIVLSWLKSDVGYLQSHLPPDGQVKIYRESGLIETLPTDRFLQETQFAFQNFRTVSFAFGNPSFEGASEAFCPAEHVLIGPDGVVRRAQVGYHLRRVPLPSHEGAGGVTTEPQAPFQWIIESVNQDISELMRARCFIATAAYGTPLAKQVQVLRKFRDRFLVSNAAGRLFVRAYYRVSPSLAPTVARHPLLAAQVRLLLKPVVAACRLMVGG